MLLLFGGITAESGATLPTSDQSILFYGAGTEEKFQSCLNRFNAVDLKNSMRTGFLDKTMHANLQQDMVIDVNKQGDIYVAPVQGDSLIVEHSGLVGSEWPVSAGEMTIQHGAITSINNESEFFQPSKASFEAVLAYLKQYGISFSPYQTGLRDYTNVSRLEDISVVEYRNKLLRGDFFYRAFTGENCFWNSATQ